jgi:hypothetical protein
MSYDIMGNPLIVVTDTSNNSIRSIAMGTINMTGNSLSFRVWNNPGGLVSIPKAVSLSIDMVHPPTRKHSIISGSNTGIRGRCTYSAKQGGVVSENLRLFPLDEIENDTLLSGQYNQYEVQFNASGLVSDQKSYLNANGECQFYLLVKSTSGGL